MNLKEKLFDIKGKTAIITGGNTGIGFAYVQALASAGVNLMIAYFAGDINNVKKVAKDNGVKVEFWQGDLTKEEAPQQLLDATIKVFKKVDILINNAGTIAREPLLEHSKDKWDRVININLNAVWSLSQIIAKHMVKNKAGKIINIASMLAFQGGKFVPGYTASKHGVAGLTKAFANELAEHNIQTNAIAPGYIISENTKPIREDKSRNASILSRIPANKWGDPEDLMGVILFLSSKASDYVNGTVICVDGGWQAR